MSELKAFKCPQCGAAIPMSETFEKTSVCPYCQAQLFFDYDAEDAQVEIKKIDADMQREQNKFNMQQAELEYQKEALHDIRHLFGGIIKFILVVSVIASLPMLIISSLENMDTKTPQSQPTTQNQRLDLRGDGDGLYAMDADALSQETKDAIAAAAVDYLDSNLPQITHDGWVRSGIEADALYLKWVDTSWAKNIVYVVCRVDFTVVGYDPNSVLASYSVQENTYSVFVPCSCNNIAGKETTAKDINIGISVLNDVEEENVIGLSDADSWTASYISPDVIDENIQMSAINNGFTLSFTSLR